jgi:FG-GAP repeat protein
MFTVSMRRVLAAVTLLIAFASSALAQTSLPLIRSSAGTLLRPTPEEQIENLVDPDRQLCLHTLGLDIAMRGNRAIAAMRSCEEGRIAVFERNSSAEWQRSGTIEPQTGGSAGPEWTLALGESRAFIMTRHGQVQVFLRSGNEWLFEETFAVPGEGPRPRLAFDQGWLVASLISEGSIPEFANLNLYQRRNGTWTLVQRLQSGEEESDFSRGSFAIEGTTLVIGAPGFDQARGAVYIYKLNNGVWVRRQRITHPDSVPFDRFGESVAIGSGLIAIGAPGAQRLDPPFCGTAGASGAAYFYVPSGARWVGRQGLSHRFADCHVGFGNDVAITATHLAVRSAGGSGSTSKIVLYRRTPEGTWSIIGRDRGLASAGLALSPTTLMIGLPSSGGLEPFGVPFEARDVGGQIHAFDLATVTAAPLR